MVETDAVRAMARATRGDALVLTLTAASTLALDLVRAVLIGLAVSVLLALRAAVRGTRLTPAAADELPGATGTVTYRFDGPLLFAAAHRFRRSLADVAGVGTVDLRLSGLTAVDATGALALRDAIGELRDRGIEVRVSGVERGHRRVLESLGVLPEIPTPKTGAIPSAAGAAAA
ncbi:STAS domain-containing protein [Streptomyces sp. NBC_00028]|uniref:STAS domain-containing protein n=1 Tax=Streptomyces sp. NBC_00028 TaxID=2975624 RepID=UPI003870ACDE